MIKLKVVLVMLFMLSCTLFKARVEPVALNIATFDPPVVYQRWADQAMACVQAMADGTTTVLPFEIEHNAVNVNQFTWIAVLTEQSDGGFPCEAPANSCAGKFNYPDTVYISGQYIQTPWVIKHEVMHYIVKSKGEKNLTHGPPWGLCEFLNN